MIIILGDCWAVGAWGKQQNNQSILAGPGLSQYISLDIAEDEIDKNQTMTINLSKPNSTNSFQLAALERLLTRFSPDFTDRFLWVVSDPARCITVEDLKNTESLKKLIENKLLSSLNYANNIAYKFKFKIELIGGLCDLNSFLNHRFFSLRYTVPSWPQLIDANYIPSLYSNLGSFYLKDIVSELRPDLIDEWNDINEHAKNKYLQFKSMKDFIVNNQPNEFAHQMLRNTLFPLKTHLL